MCSCNIPPKFHIHVQNHFVFKISLILLCESQLIWPGITVITESTHSSFRMNININMMVDSEKAGRKKSCIACLKSIIGICAKRSWGSFLKKLFTTNQKTLNCIILIPREVQIPIKIQIPLFAFIPQSRSQLKQFLNSYKINWHSLNHVFCIIALLLNFW